jgi:hypothetical protein
MSGSASGGMRPVTYQQTPLTLAPETMSPYQTKIGGGGGGVNIPATQYQVPGTNTKNQAPQMPATSTAGSTVGNVTSQLQPLMKQMMALMQQRQQNSGVPPMNSNPGGVWSGNPTQQQVGPPNPMSPASTDSMPGPPNPTTPQQPSSAQSAMGPSSDQLLASQGETSTGTPDMMGSGGSGGFSPTGSALGQGVGSALASISQAFGNMSKADMSAFQNMPKPTIQPQQANYQFNPMIGGGDLA